MAENCAVYFTIYNNEILAIYGQEDDQYPMTEQDLWEQIRKMIQKESTKKSLS